MRSWAINKAFAHDLSPALHIAEAKVIELPSGTSFAQFLMVFLHLKEAPFFLFIDVSCLVLSFEEEIYLDRLLRSCHSFNDDSYKYRQPRQLCLSYHGFLFSSLSSFPSAGGDVCSVKAVKAFTQHLASIIW